MLSRKETICDHCLCMKLKHHRISPDGAEAKQRIQAWLSPIQAIQGCLFACSHEIRCLPYSDTHASGLVSAYAGKQKNLFQMEQVGQSIVSVTRLR